MDNEKKRIMVVDDEEMICNLFQRSLTSQGYLVDIESNPLRAVDRINNSYHLVLSDLMMPGLTGVDLYEKTKQHGIDFIFVTGGTPQEGLLERAYEVGKKVLNKPLPMSELTATVNAYFYGNK